VANNLKPQNIIVMEPQQRRPRPDLGCSAIGWMDLPASIIGDSTVTMTENSGG
jgi:hypothetical protein